MFTKQVSNERFEILKFDTQIRRNCIAIVIFIFIFNQVVVDGGDTGDGSGAMELSVAFAFFTVLIGVAIR